MISYVLNGGANNSSNPKTYDVDTAVTLKNPTRIGYTFEGWYSDFGFNNKVMGIKKGTTGNRIFYAKWAIINYTNISHKDSNSNKIPRSTNIDTLKNRYKSYPEGGIAVIGTSYMSSWDAEIEFDDIGIDASKIYNFAIGGDSPASMNIDENYIKLIAEKKPKVIIIHGVNDMWGEPKDSSKNEGRVTKAYDATIGFVTNLRAQLPNTTKFILVGTLKTPSRYKVSLDSSQYTADSGPATCNCWDRVESYNSQLEDYASESANVTYFDLQPYFYKLIENNGKTYVRYYLNTEERSKDKPTGRAVKLLAEQQTNQFFRNDLHHPSSKAHREIFSELAKKAKTLL